MKHRKSYFKGLCWRPHWMDVSAYAYVLSVATDWRQLLRFRNHCNGFPPLQQNRMLYMSASAWLPKTTGARTVRTLDASRRVLCYAGKQALAQCLLACTQVRPLDSSDKSDAAFLRQAFIMPQRIWQVKLVTCHKNQLAFHLLLFDRIDWTPQRALVANNSDHLSHKQAFYQGLPEETFSPEGLVFISSLSPPYNNSGCLLPRRANETVKLHKTRVPVNLNPIAFNLKTRTLYRYERYTYILAERVTAQRRYSVSFWNIFACKRNLQAHIVVLCWLPYNENHSYVKI